MYVCMRAAILLNVMMELNMLKALSEALLTSALQNFFIPSDYA